MDLALPMLGLHSLEVLFDLLRSGLEQDDPVSANDSGLGYISRRVRYWVDGLAIGSELFVRHVMATHHPRSATRRIMRDAESDPPLACWRRLRVS